ncbi:phospholipase/carboxylesterase [Gloeothece citriformis PCC 7424]|uniref:Phospholipase/carboxylesterase n=1 Tax=Gloeothece citriformis (strain PCC 7424) TaxID=65393 RepID=B7KLL2_GLOC7|nr:alpha/beta hydrolase [Gloeothece citriformis]ACK72584.1 phospholipase/carboxylesterase [Gloeothece citriformis PCC 7424]
MLINFWIKLFLKGLGLAAITYLLICVALRLWQKRLIFHPSSTLDYTPADLGLIYEDVWISVLTWEGKREKMHGWWIPSKSSSKDVLLYLHGNGVNIGANLGPVEKFHQMGMDVLIIDYRGYGRSEGKFPSESEVYRDAQAAWDYLVLEREIAPENIFIFGHSLGGAVAIDLAVRKPNAAGVIVESSFTSMADVVDHQGIYRFLPAQLLLHQRFDTRSKLRLLRVPLLLIHGTEDRTIPPAMSQVLFDLADVPKQLCFIPLAGHNNVATVGGETYLQAVESFRQLAQTHQRQFINR